VIKAADSLHPVQAEFALQIPPDAEGEIQPLDLVIHTKGHERRVPAVIFVAGAALVREAEQADHISESSTKNEIAGVSGSHAVQFKEEGELSFDFDTPASGKYALWLRVRWKKDSRAEFSLKVADGSTRRIRAQRMFGGGNWNDPGRASTKGFLHYPKHFEDWAWYRIPEIQLTKGGQNLKLTGFAGAHFDALLLLPQKQVVDRAAMNLFQNWNYAPHKIPCKQGNMI